MTTSTPLVMIHGLLGSIDYFSPAKYLAGITVHTPDLLGYGQYRVAVEPLTLKRQADHLAHYIKTQIGQPCYVLGHSVGGAVAMLLAQQAPEWVTGVISVEGNFTLNDAFWCRKIASQEESAWSTDYTHMQSDASAWLANSHIDVTPERLTMVLHILDNQPHTTVQAMARAVVAETATDNFLAGIQTLVDNGLPIYLLAGEKSVDGWDVPIFVRTAAKADVIMPEVGHMMMLEQPQHFCRTLRSILY